MTDQSLQYSPLNTLHLQLGARMVPFAGFSMPVQYAGITQEHLTVRENVGVFDISHMGQFFVSGPHAAEWLNRLLTNNIAKLAPGQGQYTLLLNERGGVIDDLIAYRVADDAYFLVVNAAKIEEDWTWLQSHLDQGITLTNDSADFAGLAVQGPQAAALYAKLGDSLPPLPARNGVALANSDAGRIIVCRTGYTGEDGFEFFCPAATAISWMEQILASGAQPCGLGARDTLRLEMCYPLNGSDLSPDRSPLEAGLGFFVDLEKGNFMGRPALMQQKQSGLPAKLCALRLTEKGPPPRSHYPVRCGDSVIGETCSGGLSPSTGAGIALAYLPPDHAALGTAVGIEIRGKVYSAEIVKKPFYKKPN